MADKTHDTPKDDKEKLDKKLDQALKDSFPDSDPTSTLVPDRFPPTSQARRTMREMCRPRTKRNGRPEAPAPAVKGLSTDQPPPPVFSAGFCRSVL